MDPPRGAAIDGEAEQREKCDCDRQCAAAERAGLRRRLHIDANAALQREVRHERRVREELGGRNRVRLPSVAECQFDPVL